MDISGYASKPPNKSYCGFDGVLGVMTITSLWDESDDDDGRASVVDGVWLALKLKGYIFTNPLAIKSSKTMRNTCFHSLVDPTINPYIILVTIWHTNHIVVIANVYILTGF